jgi:phytoene dehydrogenase-like protein
VSLPRRVEVVVVGAGLAGLVAARRLARAGREVLLVDPNDQPGGRVRSELVDGFRLDAGFQVLLTGYPAVQEELDLAALRIHPFEPGCVVVRDGKHYSLPDALRLPGRWLEALLFPLATIEDKIRTANLRRGLRRADPAWLLRGPTRMAAAWLRDQGFSERYLSAFWIPFFSAVFLDPPLEVNSGLFRFVFRAIACGDIVLPEEGIGAVPRQLAASLPPGAWQPQARALRLLVRGGRVTGVEVAGTEAAGSEVAGAPAAAFETVEVEAGAVILACEIEEARRLSGLELPFLEPLGVSVVYFTTAHRVTDERRIFLNGGAGGPGHHAVFLDNVCPAYAPEGQHLVGVTVLGTPECSGHDLAERVRRQMQVWFPEGQVAEWRWLRTLKIPMAQFRQPPGVAEKLPGARTKVAGLFLAGDYTRHSSMQGAMESGKLAAEAVLEV